tara:strand:- start:971 stop:1837 length:867 start_codon:yes stop_codon:yes gene_type:complete
MNKENRHIKEVIDAEETITIVYGKSEEWEGIKYEESNENINENNMELDNIEENSKTISEEDIEKNAIYDEEEEENEEEELEDEERTVINKDELMEKRFFNIETRVASEGDKQVVRGHAAVFGELSEDLGGFREMINPDAFNDVLDNDVRAFFNHDPNFLLARTSAGTLRLGVDEKGLNYEFDVPDTTAGRDLLVSMERGDITQSSFAFTISEDSWATTSKGEIRTIEKVSRLYDVSPVSIPAYPSANDLTIAQRSKEIYNNKTKKENEKVFQRYTDVLGLKINLLKRK